MFQEKIEEKIQRTDRALKEFSIRLEQLEREYEELLKEVGLTPEQAQAHTLDPAAFPSAIWETLNHEAEEWREQLESELASASNPLASGKRRSERAAVQSHWLFVR